MGFGLLQSSYVEVVLYTDILVAHSAGMIAWGCPQAAIKDHSLIATGSGLSQSAHLEVVFHAPTIWASGRCRSIVVVEPKTSEAGVRSSELGVIFACKNSLPRAKWRVLVGSLSNQRVWV